MARWEVVDDIKGREQEENSAGHGGLGFYVP